MSKIWNKLSKHVFLYDFLYLGINILLSVVFYIFDLRLRIWVYLVIILIFGFIFLIGLLYLFKKNRKVFLILLIGLISFGLLCGPVLFFILVFTYSPEHVVYLEDKKYVAVVNAFLHVDVYYYDYHGPFLMGTKLRVHGDFGKGGFDPIIDEYSNRKVTYSFYDEDGNVVETKDYLNNKILVKHEDEVKDEQEENKNIEEDRVLPEDAEVLYEYKKDNHILRFVNVDYVMGQNQLIMVVESIDNGKSFKYKSDDVIQVSNEARFVFIDEDNGFAINTGKVYLDGSKVSMYVTNDGGKIFLESKFIYNKESEDTIDIEGLPYIEDCKLKIKCLEYVNKYENKELIFVSEDKGETWKLEK